MYCFTCGAKIDDEALVCPKCGSRTDHYHQEKTTQQSALNTSYTASVTQHYAEATPQDSAWATSPQYVQTTPQHYAQTTIGSASTLQGPSIQAPTQLDVADLNEYKKRMTTKHASKKKGVALLLCIFLGIFGIHRFYLGKVGTGVIWLFTVGIILIGWIVDIVLIANDTMRDKQGRKLI